MFCYATYIIPWSPVNRFLLFLFIVFVHLGVMVPSSFNSTVCCLVTIFFVKLDLSSIDTWVGCELRIYVLFQNGIMVMFIKMEEPKDFVTWLQVAKVMVLAYTLGGTAESEWCL